MICGTEVDERVARMHAGADVDLTKHFGADTIAKCPVFERNCVYLC